MKKPVGSKRPIVAIDLLLLTTSVGAGASLLAFVLSGTYQLVAILTLSGLLISLIVALGAKVFLSKSIAAVVEAALWPARALSTIFFETGFRLTGRIRNLLRCLVAYMLSVFTSLLVFGIFFLSSWAITFINRTYTPEEGPLSFMLRIASIVMMVCGAISAIAFICTSTVRSIIEFVIILRHKK